MADKGLRLLSLDGGGVRGLSSLMILEKLMDTVAVDHKSPPKPCEYFDLIGGTSTGGLIAIMLGRLEMNVKECIAAYTELWDSVFQKKRHRINVIGQLQGRFDSESLEEAIKSLLDKRDVRREELLQTSDTKAKCFVCATSKETGEVVRLRSYHSPRGRSRDVKIWEAGRATSAATTFFKPITIGHFNQTFVDGALGANNPIRELWSEAQDLWPAERFEETVQCIVSIGTGMPSTIPFRDNIFNIGESLLKMAIATEKAAEMFKRDQRRLNEQGRYYRFNVLRGLKGIGLEDTKRTGDIASATDLYLETEDVSQAIQKCSMVLSQGNLGGRTQPPPPTVTGGESEYLEICQRELHPPIVDDRFHQIQRFDAADWLLHQEAFEEWDDSDAPDKKKTSALLTIKGKPGTGKSVLMKEVVLWKTNDPRTITLYHFFDGSSNANDATTAKNSLSSFLRSLLAQLLAQVPLKPWSDIKSWAKEFEGKRDAGLWSTDRLQAAIKRIVLENKEAAKTKGLCFRVFVDAINECSDASGDAPSGQIQNGPLLALQFLSHLLNTALSAGVDMGVCVSRQYIPMYGAREPEAKVIELHKYTNAEVEKYIKAQLEKLEDEDLEYRLLVILRRNCSNGFLWATVVSQQILERSSSAKVKELEELASDVPPSLESLYQKTLSTMKVSQGSQLLQLLQLGLGAWRPMSADEFRHALAFSTDFKYETTVEWESSKEGLVAGTKFENFLQRESGGLLEIAACERPSTALLAVNEDGDYLEDEPQVLFIHSSVVSFLRGETGLCRLYKESEADLEQHCHLLLFQICLRVLDYCRLRDSGDDVKLRDYACEFWLRHAERCGALAQSVRLPAFMSSCKSQKTARVIRAHDRALRRAQAKETVVLEEQTSMMVLLATMGCTTLLRRHLATCATCKKAVEPSEEESETYRTALNNAIIGRWHDTASYLLDLNPQGDINSLFDDVTLLYDACYFASLSEDPASKAERMEVVRFLLSRGADPSVQSMLGYEYPLHVAIALGNEELIEELLRHDPDPGSGADAHAHAARAKALLAAPRIQGGWTALHFAVASPRRPRERLAMLQAVLRLAPKGVGLLGLKDGEGNTPLELAEKMYKGAVGEDLVEAFEDFGLEEEEA